MVVLSTHEKLFPSALSSHLKMNRKKKRQGIWKRALELKQKVTVQTLKNTMHLLTLLHYKQTTSQQEHTELVLAENHASLRERGGGNALGTEILLSSLCQSGLMT